MKEILEVIGATVMTLAILGTPVLAFVSFAYDWDGFLDLIFISLSIVDFMFVLSKLMGGTE